MPASCLAISDRASLPGQDLDAWISGLGEAGVPAVLIREKALADGELLALLVRARERLPAGTLLLVSGRPDLAVAAGLDGVHLPAAGLPVGAIRRRWGARLIVGRSTHRLEEIETALREGADYVTFGPVYATPSKAGFGPPQGIARLARACERGLPVLALGGVTLERLPEVAGAGARGFAAIRAFQRRERLTELVAAAELWFAPVSSTMRKGTR